VTSRPGDKASTEVDAAFEADAAFFRDPKPLLEIRSRGRGRGRSRRRKPHGIAFGVVLGCAIGLGNRRSAWARNQGPSLSTVALSSWLLPAEALLQMAAHHAPSWVDDIRRATELWKMPFTGDPHDRPLAAIQWAIAQHGDAPLPLPHAPLVPGSCSAG
jgi:hypothetical protein